MSAFDPKRTFVTLLADILCLIDGLRPDPLAPCWLSIQKHQDFATGKLCFASVEVRTPITRLVAQRPFNRNIDQQTEKIATQNANQDLNTN